MNDNNKRVASSVPPTIPTTPVKLAQRRGSQANPEDELPDPFIIPPPHTRSPLMLSADLLSHCTVLWKTGMSASNSVFVRRHMWEESSGVEREAVPEEQEGRSSGGGDMANDLSGGDLDSDFDVESEESEEVGEEGGNGGGESDINGDDTIGHCTNGQDTDDQGVGGDHLNGAAIGGASRKRGRTPSEPDFAEGGDYMSSRGSGFARYDRDSGVGDNERAEEAEEAEDEEEEVEDDGFSEDLEDDNANGLADRNCTSVDANDDAFFRGAVLEGDDEGGGFEAAIHPASSLYAASLYASSLSAHSLAQAPMNANALSVAANGLGFGISTNPLLGLRRFLEVAGGRDVEGRGAADTCSGGEADVAVEIRADVERAGEAAADALKADVAAAESTTDIRNM
ncbi:unnamed protein product [Closterium sp. NIES-65]|nr:unnamed protein product [Closterium sp. NIES-65]